jgi:hypothetical protein
MSLVLSCDHGRTTSFVWVDDFNMESHDSAVQDQDESSRIWFLHPTFLRLIRQYTLLPAPARTELYTVWRMQCKQGLNESTNILTPEAACPAHIGVINSKEEAV